MMTRKAYLVPAGICLSAILVACQVDEPDEAAVEEETEAPMEAEPEVEASVVDDQILEDAVQFAREDLAKREALDDDRIQVAEARPVVWRDGSRGCPLPDTSYTQALVEGVYIRLTVDDEDYHYHGVTDGRVRHCPPERRQEPAETGERSLM